MLSKQGLSTLAARANPLGPHPKYRTGGRHPCAFSTSGMNRVCSTVGNQRPECHIYAADSQNLLFPYTSSLRGGWT